MPTDAVTEPGPEADRLELGATSSDRARTLVVRSLVSQDDYVQCEALERATWGEALAVPASLLMVSQKVGGVTAGAVDEESGRLVGMVYGLTGPRHGRLVHWSHMLAVEPGLRGRGVGRALKLHQRRLVRKAGAETMLWTYDPLVARNAHLNINRLGARPVEYLEDLYGTDSGSQLHRGLGTDRFVVEWALRGVQAPPEPLEDALAAPVVNTRAGEPLLGAFELPDAVCWRVEIPFDIQRAKTAASDAGANWRHCTRRAVQAALERDYAVRGFVRDESTDRCFYVLAGSDAR